MWFSLFILPFLVLLVLFGPPDRVNAEERAEPLIISKSSEEEEPNLPPGLEQSPTPEKEMEEPPIPLGLETPESDEEPELPEGIKEESSQEPAQEPFYDSRFPIKLSGFLESRFGARSQNDPFERDISLGEIRSQIEFEGQRSWVGYSLTTDFLFDPVLDRHDVRLEEGTGAIDLREANIVVTPMEFVDLKLGRQVLTWGTGDFIFINDLFPKDWNSFFIGRDDEYLKAPSDALKASLFSPVVNLDVIFTPRFDADRFIDGRRISFFNDQFGRRTGRDAIVDDDTPDDWFDDNEIALRVFRNVRGYEIAAYGYWGFWKSPGGFNPSTGKATFPDLSVYGASFRGVVFKGIGNVEFGFNDSEDDRSGKDPFVKNSEFRLLLGYEQELAVDFKAGVQYYLEHMFDHDEFQSFLPPGIPETNENRHVITLRLTKLLLNQNLELSAFSFYSPSDNDAYLRPKVHYKATDNWAVQMGGNVFFGSDDHTFFAQFERNTNIYFSVRYSFRTSS